jgi:protocatechuate 3,4-dioxygenase beta subunit
MKTMMIWFICLCLAFASSVFAADSPDSSQTGISGYVFEKSSGKPIQNAEVFYKISKDNINTATDANGFFVLTGLKPSYENSISVTAKNFASSRVTIAPVEGKIIEGIKIELMPSSKVAGCVKDESGNPVPNAKAEVFQLSNQDVKTDANGFYQIDGLDPAFGNYQLSVKSKNYPAVTIEFPSAPSGQTAKMDIALKPGVTIYGKVTDPNGNPLPKVTIGNTAATNMWNGVKTKSDANGSYELKNVDKGPLVIWAIHPQYPPYVERFNIGTQESKKQINIQFENPKPLHGKVVDGQGNPVQGVSVSIRSFNGVDGLGNRNPLITDDQGKFTIENAPSSGKIVLELSSPTVPSTMPAIEIGKDQEHLIKVDTVGRIYGQVIDNAAGKAVPVFNVKLYPSQKNKKFVSGFSVTWSREGHNFNDPNGFFDTGAGAYLSIDANYIVAVYAQGYDLLTIDPVKVLAVSTEPNRTIFRLMPPSVVEGRVVDENNQPIAAASVKWFSETNKLDTSGFDRDNKDTTVTDSNGRFRLDTIGIGKRGIYVAAAGFAPFIDANLMMPEDKNEISQIVLEKGAQIFGTVYKDGKPVSGIKLRCNMPRLYESKMGTIDRQAATDANGSYRLFDLPAGEFQIYIMSPVVDYFSQILYSKKMVLSAGQKIKLDFGNEPGFTVSGHIAKGKTPINGANISFYNMETQRGEVSDSNGLYRITGLAKGHYNVTTEYTLSSSFSPMSGGNKETIQDQQQIDVNSDMTLNIELGSSSARGKIPAEFANLENIQINARRWNPQTPPDNNKTSALYWEHVMTSPNLDPNGSFSIAGLKSGKYYLALYHKYQCIAVSKFFEISPSQNLNDISFVTSSAKLKITVLDAQNKQPLADVKCFLTNDLQLSFASEPDAAYNKTNPAGQIVFDKLPKGVFALFADKDGFLPVNRDKIQLNESGDSSIEIPLEKCAFVKFILDDNAKKLITKSSARLSCKAINMETKIPYNIPTMGSPAKTQIVYLRMPQEHLKQAPPKSYISLPTGKFRLEYELTQYDEGITLSEFNSLKPFLTGQTDVNVIAEQTTEVVIK